MSNTPDEPEERLRKAEKPHNAHPMRVRGPVGMKAASQGEGHYEPNLDRSVYVMQPSWYEKASIIGVILLAMALLLSTVMITSMTTTNRGRTDRVITLLCNMDNLREDLREAPVEVQHVCFGD